MPLTRFVPRRPAAWITALIIAGACTAGVDSITGPSPSDRGATFDVSGDPTGVVISQVYGGGGNSGATYKNDFIELYNRGSSAVTVTGWSVQYASATGTSWQATALTGTIAPHGYYLVQESAGTGGTVALPTPDASAAIAMSGTAGKVALVSSSAALSGACPVAVVDIVGFGAANCSEGGHPTPTLSNTTAAIRKSGGAVDGNDNLADFDVGAPTPRNSASPPNGNPIPIGPLDHVTISGGAPSLEIGTSTQFSAVAADANNQSVAGATITWTSSDPAVTIDATGKATAASASNSPVVITATATSGALSKSSTVNLTVTAPIPDVAIVISQVYGGGGNAGATLKNDFIELFNTTDAPVSLNGWSVQYGSPTGTTWTATTLSGTIQPGGYYLVQESAGAGGTDTLPTPDAVSTLTLGAAAGKIALVRSTQLLVGACGAAGAPIADLVGFGPTANCAESNHPTAVLANTTAAIRKGNGTVDTDDNAADFDVGAPAPRNSASPKAAIAGPLDHVTITGGDETLAAGTSTDFDASGRDAANVFIGSAKITWTSSNPDAATVDKSGLVKGLVASTTPVTLTATAVANGITKTATVTITIIPPPPVASITLTPTEWSLKVGDTKQFSAAPLDANGKPTVTTFTWTSADPTIATVDEATGLVTGKGLGLVDITVTSTNGQHATATLTVNAASNVQLLSGKNSFALGMQTQFFYGGTDKSGAAVTSVVWSTGNPAIATVDQNGVVTGKALGSTQLIATTPDGSVGSTGIKIYLAAGASGLRLGHNTEFGEPKDNNPSDDFIIRRAQYTVSYNQYRGGANWVSWNLDRTHVGTNGRCVGTCYSADTALVNAGIPALTTADWVSNVPGFDGYDRGHMAPSADWTSSEADNNTTFFLSNFEPQTHDMNAGPWERLENALRDSVTAGREAYIIAGGNYGPNGLGKGTLLNKGKVAIPLSTWKVVVLTPAGTGINADGTLPENTTVMAVDMPNDYGISGDGFEKYLTTVDQIQHETGYDLLALLADNLECQVEKRDCGAATPGSNVTVYPIDPVTHTQPATISFGSVTGAGTSSVTSLASLPAGVPSLPLFQVGTTTNYYDVSTTVAFSGAASVCVAYSPADFANGTPSLLHYVNGAWLDVTTSVNTDTHQVCGSVTSFSPFAVTTLTAAQRIPLLSASMTQLAATGRMTAQDVKWFKNKLDIAGKQLATQNIQAAVNQLQEVVQRIDASRQAGQLSASDAAALSGYAQGILSAISG